MPLLFHQGIVFSSGHRNGDDVLPAHGAMDTFEIA